MDYFKHYSTASSSKLVNHLFDKMKHQGYASWFLLLELCCENWDGHCDPIFNFHERIVRQKLRISSTKLHLFLNICSTFSDLSYKYEDKEIQIEIPKLLKIKTSRVTIKSNKKQLPVYKNRIDKNRIEGEEKEEITPPSNFSNLEICPKKIVNLYNQKIAKVGKCKAYPCIGLVGQDLSEFKLTLGHFPDEKTWIDYFDQIALTKKMTGRCKNFKLVINLGWAVKLKNITDVLGGKYQDDDIEVEGKLPTLMTEEQREQFDIDYRS